ncbi:hypothetical protein Gotri_012835 [Gossypium trilobum]|uniref:Glutaredoxin domain-containing protein n=1 Tax=Gossypium trilobum TaxID=34281 RepID=A0A7J9DRN1_9ROSI|nr:hypothetical protein [Gossypium trilobum]
MEMVTRMVANRPVVIFSRTTCCMSHTIKTLISGFGANSTVYELDEVPYGGQIERALQQMGCKPSVPVVFIGQQLIGESMAQTLVLIEVIWLCLECPSLLDSSCNPMLTHPRYIHQLLQKGRHQINLSECEATVGKIPKLSKSSRKTLIYYHVKQIR